MGILVVVQWLKYEAGSVWQGGDRPPDRPSDRLRTHGRSIQTVVLCCVAGEDCTVSGVLCVRVCVCLPCASSARRSPLATHQPACPGYWPKIVTPKRARAEMDGGRGEGKKGWPGKHHRLVNIVCYPLRRRNASSDESSMKTD